LPDFPPAWLYSLVTVPVLRCCDDALHCICFVELQQSITKYRFSLDIYFSTYIALDVIAGRSII